MPDIECTACHEQRHDKQMISPETLPASITQQLQAKKPDWSPDQPVCEVCVNEAIAADAEDMLEEEMQGELTELEREVINSLRQGSMLAHNVAEMDEDEYLSSSERFADRIANTVGSFAFSASVLICVVLWLYYGMTSGMMSERPAFVFGGLSSALGTLAAIQNPIILMSQRRATRRDRLRSENDYRVNLKSELEVRYINAKLDTMLEKISKLHAE